MASLRDIWKNWHLNDMHAECDHMLNEWGQVCPETGYRHGFAWLYRAIPDDVLREFERLMALPTGNVPSYL